MQHQPPEPGQPVVINPVTVAAEGIVAAAITIPAMWVFAGAFVPAESARRLKKLFRFLVMLPFMIVLWLVRLVRRRAQRWMCGRFSLASERKHEAAPSPEPPHDSRSRPLPSSMKSVPRDSTVEKEARTRTPMPIPSPKP